MRKDPSRERQSPDWLPPPDRPGDGGDAGEDGGFGGREECQSGGREVCQSGDWRSQRRSQRRSQGQGQEVLGNFRSRGYLPHLEGESLIQHVTVHLADSLPKQAIDRIEESLKGVPEDRRTVERRRRVEAWLDAGHGSCVLRHPEIAEMVQNALLHFDDVRYRVFAWVVMPNHFHVLLQSMNGWEIGKIVASWKKYTARGIRDFLRNAEEGNANLPIGSSEPTKKEKNANQEIGVPGGVPKGPVWHREYWDRYIRDDRHYVRVVEYIHDNPMMAGLVDRAEAWAWTSAASSSHWEVLE